VTGSLPLELAQRATSSEARLIHYDLAGRYSVKANSAEAVASDLVDSLPPSIYAKRPCTMAKDPLDA
jgi:hypothetical protein